jgi:hypothetical protein
MLIGFIRGELSIAFQDVTPKLLVLACSVLIAFKLNDHLGPIHYRYSAITGIVLISAMINILAMFPLTVVECETACFH